MRAPGGGHSCVEDQGWELPRLLHTVETDVLTILVFLVDTRDDVYQQLVQQLRD